MCDLETVKKKKKKEVIVKLVYEVVVYTPGTNYVTQGFISFLYALIHNASKNLFTCQMCDKVQPNEVIKGCGTLTFFCDLIDETFIIEVQFMI